VISFQPYQIGIRYPIISRRRLTYQFNNKLVASISPDLKWKERFPI